jgi:hypothetical protein
MSQRQVEPGSEGAPFDRPTTEGAYATSSVRFASTYRLVLSCLSLVSTPQSKVFNLDLYCLGGGMVTDAAYRALEVEHDALRQRVEELSAHVGMLTEQVVAALQRIAKLKAKKTPPQRS